MENRRTQPIGIELVRRGIVTEEDINKALDYQKSHPTKKIGDILYEQENYKEAVRANNPEALVAIIKMIYQRKQKRLAQGKKCTATDARYFQIAENLLYMELGVALEKPKQEICKTIIDYIDQNKID